MGKIIFLCSVLLVITLETSFWSQTPTPIPTIPLSSKDKAESTIDFRVDDLSIFAQSKLIRLENITAAEIEPFIRARLSQFGSVQTNDIENLVIITDREPKLSDLEKLVKELDKVGKKGFLRLETEVIPVQYIKASKVVNIARQRLSLEGTVEADDDLNIVIITDLKSKIEQFKEIIKSIDIPLKQILVEARVVEVRKSKTKNIGIDWASTFKSILSGTLDWQLSKGESRSQQTVSKTEQERFSLGVNVSARLDGILQILDERGDINLIATPRIVTVNNKVGEFYSSGGKFRLTITPTIGISDKITLDTQITAQDGQYVNSTVLVKNNETFIMGGLKMKTVEKKSRKFPILGYILPYIFSKETLTEEESELVFFITPAIVTETSQPSPK